MTQTLTSRERLTRLFEGKPIDRVPIHLLFPWFDIGHYARVRELSSYRPLVDLVYGKTDFLDRRGFDHGFCFTDHPDIAHAHSETKEDGQTVSRHTVRCRGITLERTVKRREDMSLVEPFVRDAADLQKVLDLPYRQPKPEVEQFFREEREYGSAGLFGVGIGDPVNTLHALCGETDFALWVYSEPERTRAFLDEMLRRSLAVMRHLLDQNVGDFYWFSGAEFIIPPVQSPELFGELSQAYLKPLVDLVHSYRKKFFLHCHGTIGRVLPEIAALGCDAHHPIEAPPMGDCTLTQAWDAFGKDAVLLGNIQYGDLWSKTEDEIETLVRQTLDEGMKGGRFILAVTGGPYAEEIPESAVRNYRRFVETALEHGKYS